MTVPVPTWQRCEQCGGRYINRGGHAEMCPGPFQRVAPPVAPDPGSKCECNHGGMHDPDCGHVTGQAYDIRWNTDGLCERG